MQYQPNFKITNQILKHIGTIEACKEVITNAPLVPAWEAKFRQEAIIRTIHHGTHIEGNALNYSEAAQVVEGKEIVGRDRDIQEVLNYRRVLDFIDKFHELDEKEISLTDIKDSTDREIIQQAKGEITEAVVLHIHNLTTNRILPSDQVGKYRKIQVVVKNSQTGEITFRPPPAIEVPFQVRGYLNYLNQTKGDTLHPIIRAGITQYELVRIHPFIDGNGRVARAIATLCLFLDGYDIKKFFSLDEYYDQEAMRYYQSLQSVEKNQGDMSSWLEYFTEGLAIELTRVKEKVQNLSRDIKLKEQLGGEQYALTPRQIKIIEHIQQTGFIQNRIFFELFPMISEDTVLRELRDLMDKGIIVKKGVTKGARYVMRG